jgi:PAS domain-containing protein
MVTNEEQCPVREVHEGRDADFVMTYTPDGNVVWASDALLVRLGYSRKAFDDGFIDWNDSTPPEYWDLEDRCFGELQRSNVAGPFVKELLCKDGSRIAVRVRTARTVRQGDALIVALMTELREDPAPQA